MEITLCLAFGYGKTFDALDQDMLWDKRNENTVFQINRMLFSLFTMDQFKDSLMKSNVN